MSRPVEAMSDLICFSHLRWHFVWQRPQHLLSRASRDRRVWFVEEPQFAEGEPRLEIVRVSPQLSVVTPQLPPRLDESGQRRAMQALMESWWRARAFDLPLTWYYTPMAWACSTR